MTIMQAAQTLVPRDRWAWSGATALAQLGGTVAPLVLLGWALLGGSWPRWPLVAGMGLLCIAAVTERRARSAGDLPARFGQPAFAFAALLVLGFGMTAPHPSSSLCGVAALLLGAGLAAGPAGRRLIGRRAGDGSALPFAALAVLLVFVWVLSADGYWWYTLSPAAKHIADRIDVGTLRLVILLLGLVLVAAGLGVSVARRLLSMLAATGAAALLGATLAWPPADGLSPQWPFWCGLVILSVGLMVELLPWLSGVSPVSVLAARVDELSRTRSGALDVQAAELRRIERDLHDGAQVRLIALSMKLGRAEELYRDDPRTAALLRDAREDATEAIRELRELARGIAPPVLAKRGLEAAVRSLAQRSGVPVAVNCTLTRRLLPALETAAYFVVAESLANAAKHATGARVEIGLHEHGVDLCVEITDFGPGGADPAGSGLTGLRQRVEALDGTLHVTSPAGVGTQVEAVMPCEP